VPAAVSSSRRFVTIEAAVLTRGIEVDTSLGYCWGRNYPQPTLAGGGRQYSSIIAGYGNAFAIELLTGHGYYWGYHDLSPVPLLP
jgi:hypothetical protein